MCRYHGQRLKSNPMFLEKDYNNKNLFTEEKRTKNKTN